MKQEACEIRILCILCEYVSITLNYFSSFEKLTQKENTLQVHNENLKKKSSAYIFFNGLYNPYSQAPLY